MKVGIVYKDGRKEIKEFNIKLFWLDKLIRTENLRGTRVLVLVKG